MNSQYGKGLKFWWNFGGFKKDFATREGDFAHGQSLIGRFTLFIMSELMASKSLGISSHLSVKRLADSIESM